MEAPRLKSLELVLLQNLKHYHRLNEIVMMEVLMREIIVRQRVLPRLEVVFERQPLQDSLQMIPLGKLCLDCKT